MLCRVIDVISLIYSYRGSPHQHARSKSLNIPPGDFTAVNCHLSATADPPNQCPLSFLHANSLTYVRKDPPNLQASHNFPCIHPPLGLCVRTVVHSALSSYSLPSSRVFLQKKTSLNNSLSCILLIFSHAHTIFHGYQERHY